MNNNNTDLIYTDEHIESDDIIKSMVQFIQTSREFLKFHDICLRQKVGTSMMKFLALMILENKQGKISPSELARLSQTKRHNITTLIRRMEKDGDIKIRRSRLDRRGLNISITEKGKETLAKSYEVGKKIAYDTLGSFSKNDLRSFSDQLAFVMNNTRSALQSLANDKKTRIHERKK